METTPEESAEGLAIVRVLAAVLDRLVCANAPIALSDPGQVTKFHAMKAPGIAIQQYLERIHKYASCSNECFILALIYIDRLIQRNNFLLTELNVHRVVITAILLAAKFFDDAYYNNAYYAKVGGVLTSEINGLEVDFLFRINFSLFVTTDEFDKYRAELLTHLTSSASPLIVPQVIMLEQNLFGNPNVQHQQTHQHQLQSSTLAPSPEQQAAAAAVAALSAQVAIQQALEQQNNVGIYGNDGISNSFVQLASQITPSPPCPAIDANQLISSILNSNPQTSADEMITAANNNIIMQSWEFLQQTLDGGNGYNSSNLTYVPIMQRTNSLPVKLGCGVSSQYQEYSNTTPMNHATATFSANQPQSCSITSIQSNQSFALPMEEQYIRLLVESTQQQQSLQQQQQQQQQLYEIDQCPQQPQHHHIQHNHSAHHLGVPVSSLVISSSPSGAYNNMIALQNEARRIAVSQGHMLAAAGLGGPGF